ncbi:MAG TPA: cytochrome c oxidase assembly protein [Acidimicrobiia bacterium]
MPPWHLHLDVWLVAALLAGGYRYANSGIGPHLVRPGEPIVTGRQQAAWYSGVCLLLVVSSWPFHDIGEQSLYTVHMLEHLIIVLGVAPLLLVGTPRWMASAFLRPPWLVPIVRGLSRPLIAFLIFNTVLAAIHAPAVVELMVTSSPAHLTVHGVLFMAALLMWMPVLSPHPAIPRLRPPVAMAYLFAQSLIPTVPASFLTFSSAALYEHYAQAQLLWGMDPVTDQAIAGLIMKLAGGFFLWTVIAVMWFRWYRQEREWDALERRLRTG